MEEKTLSALLRYLFHQRRLQSQMPRDKEESLWQQLKTMLCKEDT